MPFPKIKAQFDGGLQGETAAWSWVLFVSSSLGAEDVPQWQEVAFGANIMDTPSVALAELTGACEACRAALQLLRGTLKVDSTGRPQRT